MVEMCSEDMEGRLISLSLTRLGLDSDGQPRAPRIDASDPLGTGARLNLNVQQYTPVQG